MFVTKFKIETSLWEKIKSAFRFVRDAVVVVVLIYILLILNLAIFIRYTLLK